MRRTIKGRSGFELCKIFEGGWREVLEEVDGELDATYGGGEAIIKITLEEPNKIHLCDKCLRGFPTCNGKNIKWGIDKNPELRGADADRVIECDCFEATQ